MDPATPDRFRDLVGRSFRYLEARGFRPDPGGDRDSPVGASYVWTGTHVGFIITWDARDDVVDMRVVRVRDGRILDAGEPGGYARDLFVHLVEHAGYRGSPSGTHGSANHSPTRLERAVAAWANLLERAGGILLEDRPESLPTDG